MKGIIPGFLFFFVLLVINQQPIPHLEIIILGWGEGQTVWHELSVDNRKCLLADHYLHTKHRIGCCRLKRKGKLNVEKSIFTYSLKKVYCKKRLQSKYISYLKPFFKQLMLFWGIILLPVKNSILWIMIPFEQREIWFAVGPNSDARSLRIDFFSLQSIFYWAVFYFVF